jgi:hypothetical protein
MPTADWYERRNEMPIAGGLREKLEPGTILIAKYKGGEHRAEVIRDGGGKTRYRLEDGREFKSPSSAASAVMGGIAANGWRFWSLEADTPAIDANSGPVNAPRPRKLKGSPEPVETAKSEASTEEAATE